MGERLDKLLKMLEKQPNDTFLLYGIALEHHKLGNPLAALEFFDRVLALDPNYCYAYHRKGQILEETGDLEGARAAYRAGVEAAERAGDDHAREELAASLLMIE